LLAAHAAIVLLTTGTGLLLTRVGLPKAFRLRKLPRDREEQFAVTAYI
jgi:hypothetical protein